MVQPFGGYAATLLAILGFELMVSVSRFEAVFFLEAVVR